MTISSEIDTYVTLNAGSSGNTIKDNLSPVRKTRKVKHHIAKLVRDGTLTISTTDSSTPFKQWALDGYTS